MKAESRIKERLSNMQEGRKNAYNLWENAKDDKVKSVWMNTIDELDTIIGTILWVLDEDTRND